MHRCIAGFAVVAPKRSSYDYKISHWGSGWGCFGVWAVSFRRMFNRYLPYHLQSVDQHDLRHYRGPCHRGIRETLKVNHDDRRDSGGQGAF